MIAANTAPLIPVKGIAELSAVSDGDLLASTRQLAGRSNQLLAALLLHLGEVEARGLHRSRACASLYTYCVFELRLSEDEAFRRVTAARLVRRFPALLSAVARGELHLTGLLLLGPHLTPENVCDVLARARHRTKKEITRLVRELAPLPDVPACIEPLGPAPARAIPPGNPSWQQWVGSLCPVRELAPEERPAAWLSAGTEGANDVDGTNDAECTHGADEGEGTAETDDAAPEGSAPARLEQAAPATEGSAPARLEQAAPAPGAQRYRVAFTAGAEHVRLVERAKALLSHAEPTVALEELHLRAMRLLVAELEKKKYAVVRRPRPRASEPEAPATTPEPPAVTPEPQPIPKTGPSDPSSSKPRRRGRHVPAAVRRAVFERDAGRCSYLDPRGERCRETHWLELHHREPFARGGEHSLNNLTLRCRSHNALAAEADFGRELVAERRDAPDHESARRAAAELLGESLRGGP